MDHKIIGSDIDKQVHSELLYNFAEFVKSFSPLLDSAEKYNQLISSIKLIDSDNSSIEKLEIIQEICQVLTEMVPLFIRFSILESKLENIIDN